MGKKVQELKKITTSTPVGPSCTCAYCDPRPDRVGADKVWRWALAHPGESVWR
jgi:hypothetical protein